MELRRWQELYAWAETAASAFFSEHFGDMCAHCARTAGTLPDPSLNCCRRTNLFPDILADPLLGGLAEESLGHSLLTLAGSLNTRSCAALGPQGCRIPLGRADICYIYMCDAIHECLDQVVAAEHRCRLQDALEVFTRIREARRSDDAEYYACAQQVEELEGILAFLSRQIKERAEAFAARKAEAIHDWLPPASGVYPITS